MRIIAILLSLACLSCRSEQPAAGPPKAVRNFLGDHAVAVLSNPERVEVFRITPERTRPTTNATTSPATIAGYPIVSVAPAQDAAFAREFAAIFLSPDAYMFDAGKRCVFQPDHLFRIHGPSGWVDIVTCFHCQEFKMSSHDESGKQVHSGQEDFDHVRDRLAVMVKRATGEEPYHD